jgi:hypothetical protein
MIGRRPLFPGKNFIQQLTLIFDVIGAPQPSQVAHIHNSQAKKFLSSQHGKRKVPYHILFPECNGEVLQLIDAMINFDPNSRYTIDEVFICMYIYMYIYGQICLGLGHVMDLSKTFSLHFGRYIFDKFFFLLFYCNIFVMS